MWNYSFKDREQSVAVRRVQFSPCLQVKGQIFVEPRCQSSPSCQCGRRCPPSLGWRKHPAGTWAPRVERAGCVWTYTQDHLGGGSKQWVTTSADWKLDAEWEMWRAKNVLLPPLFRSSSTFSDRILTFFFFSSCMITLLLGAGWRRQKSIYGETIQALLFLCVSATTKQNACCEKIHSHLCGAGWRTARGSGRCRAAAQWDQMEVRPPPHPAETQQSQHSNVLKAGIILIKEHIIPLMHLLIHACQASRSVQLWESLCNLSNGVKMHRHEGKHSCFSLFWKESTLFIDDQSTSVQLFWL